jgi:hypothetical protein
MRAMTIMTVSKGVFITTSLCAQPAAIGRDERSPRDASRKKLRQFTSVHRNPPRDAVSVTINAQATNKFGKNVSMISGTRGCSGHRKNDVVNSFPHFGQTQK